MEWNVKYLWDSSMTAFIISVVVLLLVFAFVYLCLYKVCRKRSVFICTSIALVLSIATLIFELFYAFIAVVVVFAVFLIAIIFANIGDVRSFVANPFKKTITKQRATIDKIYDKNEVFSKVNLAVQQMSKSKIGAIITFEKNVVLQESVEKGIAINAPISTELLLTIFYPGTRLHDGAVIIHGDQILAASCFYTPSTKVLSEKYGSRHRAALGISEISDSVTVVVSEETGRISIAYNGMLDTVSQDKFLNVFTNYMNEGIEPNKKK